MTICKLCGKEIKHIKGRRATEEPQYGKHPECERKEGMIYLKNRLNNDILLKVAIDALIECNEEQFTGSGKWIRFQHRLWKANGELKQTFPYLREKSGQKMITDYDTRNKDSGV